MPARHATAAPVVPAAAPKQAKAAETKQKPNGRGASLRDSLQQMNVITTVKSSAKDSKVETVPAPAPVPSVEKKSTRQARPAPAPNGAEKEKTDTKPISKPTNQAPEEASATAKPVASKKPSSAKSVADTPPAPPAVSISKVAPLAPPGLEAPVVVASRRRRKIDDSEGADSLVTALSGMVVSGDTVTEKSVPKAKSAPKAKAVPVSASPANDSKLVTSETEALPKRSTRNRAAKSLDTA